MITVCDRLCLSRPCVLKWTGEGECIYRSSGKVSAGYELGWEYVDMVNTGKQTFQGFVTIMNNRYKSRGPESLLFMTLPTLHLILTCTIFKKKKNLVHIDTCYRNACLFS